MPNTVTATVVAIILLIALNGILAMSEIALVAARHTRLRRRAEGGARGARAALMLQSRPGRFFSTVQLWITLIGVLAGALGEASLARPLEQTLRAVPALAGYARAISLATVVFGIGLLSVVFGELVPKRVAMAHAETVASALAPLMRMLARVAAPAVHVLTTLTDAVLRLVRLRPPVEPAVTEEDIRLMIEQGMQAGVVEPVEREILERVFRLGDRRVTALMTPRTEVVSIDHADPPDVVRQKITDSGHAHFPVVRGSLDRVVGSLHTKDVLAQVLGGRPLDVRSITRPPLYVPEAMTGLKVLQRFKDTGSAVALVIDEFGGVEGLVTPSDILEAIVGEMPPSDEVSEPQIVRREDGSWLVEGRLPIDELKRLLGLERLPDEASAEYETLGGLVMAVLGRVPVSGDHFEMAGFRVEVVDMDGRRVDKVLIAPGAQPGAD